MEITGKKQKLRKNAFILFFLLPTLVCFCVFYLYPIATVVISSLDFHHLFRPEQPSPEVSLSKVASSHKIPFLFAPQILLAHIILLYDIMSQS